MTRRTKLQLGVVGVAVAFIVVVSQCTAFGSSDGGGGDQPPKSEGLVNCRRAVEEQVTNPDSVDWHSLDTTVTDSRVSGTFDAQNDFGAVKTMRYSCTMDAETRTVIDSSVTED